MSAVLRAELAALQDDLEKWRAAFSRETEQRVRLFRALSALLATGREGTASAHTAARTDALRALEECR
jgi:hypothetical protein